MKRRKDLYENERDQTIDLILEYMNEKYKNLKIQKKDLNIL